MIHLILAILCSAALSITLKIFRNQKGNKYGLITGNYLACIILSLLMMPDKSLVVHPSGVTLACSLVTGVFFVLGLVSLQESIKKNGASLSAAFARLGIVVSLTASILVFRERPGALQIVGIGIVLAAIFLINSESAAAGQPISGRSSAKPLSAGKTSADRPLSAGQAYGTEQPSPASRISLLLLLMTLIFCGLSDTMSKVFERWGSRGEDVLFFFYLFVTAIVISSVLAWREYRVSGKKISGKTFCAGLLAGVPNYLSSYFMLKALVTLPAFLTYSVYSTGVILVVSAVSFLAFRERIGRRSLAAMGLILAALVLLQL